jgi:hypothetical protein
MNFSISEMNFLPHGAGSRPTLASLHLNEMNLMNYDCIYRRIWYKIINIILQYKSLWLIKGVIFVILENLKIDPSN